MFYAISILLENCRISEMSTYIIFLRRRLFIMNLKFYNGMKCSFKTVYNLMHLVGNN